MIEGVKAACGIGYLINEAGVWWRLRSSGWNPASPQFFGGDLPGKRISLHTWLGPRSVRRLLAQARIYFRYHSKATAEDGAPRRAGEPHVAAPTPV